MLIRLERGLSHLFEHIAEAHRGLQSHAHGQRIDKEADQRLHVRILPIGNNIQSSKYSAPCRAGAGGKAIAMRTISRPKIIGAISPPPYAQSSPPKPDAEANQSPPAAHRDDSLATNPSAGLVTEDHPSKRRRGGWGLAGVFAVVAWLAWLACPTAAFALTNTLSISSVAGDNVVTASEKWNGFKITGHTGNQSNIPVMVTFGTETWNTTSTTLIDGNYWWSVSVPGKSSYITDGDNQTVNAEATFSGVPPLSHSRTFNVDLTLPLVVDAVTGDDVINDGVIHITGDTGDIGSVRIDLVIGTGSFINVSDLAGEWLQTVCQGRRKTRPEGRRENRPLPVREGVDLLDRAGVAGAEACASVQAARLGRSGRHPSPIVATCGEG